MRKRNNRIVFYLNNGELNKLNSDVSKTPHSREAFIRAVLNGCTVKEAPPADYFAILSKISRESANLNQLLLVARTKGFLDTPKIERLIEEVRSTNQMLWDAFTEKEDGSHENLGRSRPGR